MAFLLAAATVVAAEGCLLIAAGSGLYGGLAMAAATGLLLVSVLAGRTAR